MSLYPTPCIHSLKQTYRYSSQDIGSYYEEIKCSWLKFHINPVSEREAVTTGLKFQQLIADT